MSLRILGSILSFAVFCTVAVSAKADEAYFVKKLLIADTVEGAAAMQPADGGTSLVVVHDVAFLEASDFTQAMQKFIGRKIDTSLLNELVLAITQYSRDHDRLVTKVQIPNQDIKAGALRLAVIVGRYRDLSFVGNRWFSRKLLEQKLAIKPGDEVRLSTLEQAVNWENTNPFRQVKVAINDLQQDPGKANLIVATQDIRPVRFSASYDNYGPDILGRDRYTASVQFGNLWGADHQGSYQIVTSDRPRDFLGQGIDYKIPLPWRHWIEFSGSYTQMQPVFGGGHFTQKGETEIADARYTIPLRTGNDPMEFYTGIDFKESNNNLEFGGFSVLASKTDTFQATAGFSDVHHDKHGAWVFGASINASPGGINQRNTTENFQHARAGSKANYLVGIVSLQRLQNLGHGWDLFSRVSGQVASSNLLPNEQLTIGGATTVRGYHTNVYAGDEGFDFNNDLASPTLHLKVPHQSNKLPAIDTRFLAFYDVGQVFFRNRYIYDPIVRPLASAGLGVEMSVSNNFSLNFTYGWQITHLPYVTPDHGRANLKVVLAF